MQVLAGASPLRTFRNCLPPWRLGFHLPAWGSGRWGVWAGSLIGGAGGGAGVLKVLQPRGQGMEQAWNRGSSAHGFNNGFKKLSTSQKKKSLKKRNCFSKFIVWWSHLPTVFFQTGRFLENQNVRKLMRVVDGDLEFLVDGDLEFLYLEVWVSHCLLVLCTLRLHITGSLGWGLGWN